MAYRHYVLCLLLLVYIHCLLSRMLPAFLVSVPTPGCDLACAGADAEPLCHRQGGWREGGEVGDSAFARCQDCRARVGNYASAVPNGNWFNMRDGACIAPWQYGLLVGYGFALPFVLGSFATAQLVDRVDRRCVLALAVGVWSWASGIMACVSSFWPLLVSRFLLGVSEAFVVPAALSLVTHYFDEGSHGSAGSILSAGVCLGAGAASWAVPLALHVGWRATCALTGAAGVVLSLLVFATIREPPRELRDKSCCERPSLRRPAVWTLAAAASLRLAASYAIAAFLPLYYLRARLPGYSADTYGTANAIIVATTGLMSALLGGAAADYLQFASAPSVIAALSQLVAAVLFVGVFWASTFAGSLVFYGAALLVGECWYGLTLVQVKKAVPLEMQGQTVTLVLSVATIVSNLSPALVGAFDPGTVALGSIMLRVITSCTILAAGLFLIGAWEIECQQWGMEEGLLSEASTPSAKSPSLPERNCSFVSTMTTGIKRQASRQTFFAAPGHTTEIWVPNIASDHSPYTGRGKERSSSFQTL